jgi:ATP-dependent Clp protease ATP-binding subunit ClpX
MVGKNIDIEEMQKDISDYVSRKYGIKFKIAAFGTAPEAAREKGEEEAKESKNEMASIHFDMKPGELKAYLDEYMVKQDEAKQVLATKICTHFNRIKRFELNRKKKRSETVGEIKSNIIMIGPTGVGKTFLVKLIANKIGVPFVKGDATKFSETGYVGGDVEDLVRDLVHEANGNIELAQYGIIYLDEVDKLAASRGLMGPDVSRSGVQRALLKPLEETEVELKVPHDPISQMEAVQEFQRTGKREKKKISTKHILFIMSGAFNGLEGIVERRRHQKGIGFNAEMPAKAKQAEHLRHLKAEDLIQYGFESEFIGRLPVVTVFEYLETEDLYKILCNPKSPILIGKKRDFKAYGIDLQFEDEALRKIAENAALERTGARGLVSAVEHVLMKFEHTLPSTDIRCLLVTPAMVDDPAGELEKILAHPEEPEREATFRCLAAVEEERLAELAAGRIPEWESAYGVPFADDRVRLIIRYALDRQIDVDVAAEEFHAIQKAVQDFTNEFCRANDLEASFSDGAVDALAEKVWREPLDPAEYLKCALHNYGHGLRLIREKTGKRKFLIPAGGVDDPEQYLNCLIQDAYRQMG